MHAVHNLVDLRIGEAAVIGKPDVVGVEIDIRDLGRWYREGAVELSARLLVVGVKCSPTKVIS